MAKVSNISDEALCNIIDSVTEFMYCNYGDCHIGKMTWAELEEARACIKEYAMDMIKSNLETSKLI